MEQQEREYDIYKKYKFSETTVSRGRAGTSDSAQVAIADTSDSAQIRDEGNYVYPTHRIGYDGKKLDFTNGF